MSTGNCNSSQVKLKNSIYTAILIITFVIIVFSCKSQEVIIEPKRITEQLIHFKYHPIEKTFQLSLIGIPVKEFKSKK